MTDLVVMPDGAGLARVAAERFVNAASDAIDHRGRFLVALSGGSTPKATYELLAETPHATQVAWRRVHVFWGDERCVPPDHANSNYRMAREALLDHVQIPAENVHRVRGELAPSHAAAAYQAELEDVIGEGGRFDLILLGVGTDGHTASLFPGTTALDERERSAVAVFVEELNAWRVTLTLPTINAARSIVFLVSGRTKAPALARVHAGEPLPAGMVQPTDGRLTWVVDRAAAAGLPQR